MHAGGRWLRATTSAVVVSLLTLYVVHAQLELAAAEEAGPGTRTEHTDGGADHAGHGGMRMSEPVGASFVASAVDLPTRGWTARSGTAARSRPASAAFDGRRATSWQSASGARGPHRLQVDTRRLQTVSGLRYTPAGARERIGAYTISVSDDGRRWRRVLRGVWADDATTKTASFAPTRARYVRVDATAARGGTARVAAAEVALVGGEVGPALDRTGWTATADSAEQGEPAQHAIDDDPSTIWHTEYRLRSPGPPHQVTIDMKASLSVAALSYTPRQEGVNGRIGQYAVSLSQDGVTWTAPVASGTWVDDGATKTVPFTAQDARYVRLTATSEAGGRGPWTSASEINLYGPVVALGPTLDRTGWTATADSAEQGEPAQHAIDDDPSTIWHTEYRLRSPGPPHQVTIDMKAPLAVAALSYTPRQDGVNGRIGRFSIALSQDGTTWTPSVASGTWADDGSTRTVPFTAQDARYVRLTALSEAGGRGPWTSASDIAIHAPATALGPALDPADWRATADSSSASDPVGNAIDGSPATFWHTTYGADITPYPHSISIDTRARHRLTALTYLPRQDGSVNGTVGRYRVEVSDDGLAWRPVASGTWPDDRTLKTARFAPVEARHARLVALTEAGGRGVWASAAEVGLHGTLVDPGTAGRWGEVIGLPIVPTSAILLPNDKVLTFSAATSTGFDYVTPTTQISIVDVRAGTTGRREISQTGHQMFCTGISVLADGRVVITGGSSPSNTTIYDPYTDTFTAGPDMELPRGYQTSVTLSNGAVFTIGGSWSGAVGGKDAEVLSADATAWTRLPGVKATKILTDDKEGVYRSDNHAWLFAASGGRVFHAGPSDQMNWFTTTGDGTSTAAGERADAPDQMNGNAVMYDVGRILAFGGAPDYNNSDATAGAWAIDISDGPSADPVVSRVGDMSVPRGFQNGVVLPDGSVLATGGQRRPVNFTDTGATRTAELWTPATGTWRTLAAEAVPRTYHSFSLLLADGRVLSGGGGLCGDCTVNHPDVQVFTPPYLLEPDGSPRARPAITGSVPATLGAGGTVRVSVDRPVASWALVRTGTATHSINSDQRRIPVAATRVGSTTSYDLAIPADRGTTVPGTYLLFALDAAGTPSVARWVRIP